MNIRKSDNVIMLQGKDRGKTGKILSVDLKAGKVFVEGLNMIKKHQKARKQGQVGQMVSKERGVEFSNVQIVCPKCSKPTRVGQTVLSDKKFRTCKKCMSEI